MDPLVIRLVGPLTVTRGGHDLPVPQVGSRKGRTLLAVLATAGGTVVPLDQVGEPAIRRIATDAGFTRFRRAAETPFNLVYEIRP